MKTRRAPHPLSTTVRKVLRKNIDTATAIRHQEQARVAPALASMQHKIDTFSPMDTSVKRNRQAQDIQVKTLPSAMNPEVQRASEALSENATLRGAHAKSEAQLAWLQDIMTGPYGGSQSGQKRVFDHFTAERRQTEAANVLSTLGFAAQYGSPGEFSAAFRGRDLEGLMSTTTTQDATKNKAIGFVSTHPKNISGPTTSKTGGVGSAMIGHANHLGKKVGATHLALGAEGKEAQGFYRHVGFTHEDGRPIRVQDFIHGTLPLKREIE